MYTPLTHRLSTTWRYDKAMQVSKPNNAKIATQRPKGVEVDRKSLDRSSEKGSVLRDVVAIGAGATAGVAGGIYGLAEGLVKNGIENYPAHVKTGAKIGKSILTPVGGALGAITTGIVTAGAAIGAPVVAGLSIGVGFLAGTGISAVKQAPSSIAEGARKGAASGASVGSGLGAVGRFVGSFVGGALGGIAGAVAAVAKGLPGGIDLAKSEAKAGKELITGLPQFTKDTWNVAYKGGRGLAGGVGSLGGGSVGLLTASGETLFEGGANSLHRGAQWAQKTHGFISGTQKTEPPKA
jgi:hypothetical protein